MGGTIPAPLGKTGVRRDQARVGQNCLDAKGVGREEWEKQTNEPADALYGARRNYGV